MTRVLFRGYKERSKFRVRLIRTLLIVHLALNIDVRFSLILEVKRCKYSMRPLGETFEFIAFEHKETYLRINIEF